MKDEYDFSKAKKNPYAKKLKKQVTIHYFKDLSVENGIPYQSLINLFLRDCAASRKKLRIKWAS